MTLDERAVVRFPYKNDKGNIIESSIPNQKAFKNGFKQSAYLTTKAINKIISNVHGKKAAGIVTMYLTQLKEEISKSIDGK